MCCSASVISFMCMFMWPALVASGPSPRAPARGGTAAARGGGGRDTRPHRPRPALTRGENAVRGDGVRGRPAAVAYGL
eukprot:3072461-Prymnesium_polylepis.1